MKKDCAHHACTCRHDAAEMIQEDGEYYCSSDCMEAGTDAQSCQCGHPDCDG